MLHVLCVEIASKLTNMPLCEYFKNHPFKNRVYMSTLKTPSVVPDETIINKIYYVRGQKVMLDRDLAALYGVTTGNLNKAVKRNEKRFPEDFMFRLVEKEYKDLMFQSGISSWGEPEKCHTYLQSRA